MENVHWQQLCGNEVLTQLLPFSQNGILYEKNELTLSTTLQATAPPYTQGLRTINCQLIVSDKKKTIKSIVVAPIKIMI